MVKGKVIKNYFFNAGYQVFALIVPLITTPYISRVLTAEGIGVYSYTYSMVCYFTLFAVLGSTTYGNRMFGILQDQPVERTKKFWDLFSFRLITSSVALAVYLVYVVLFAEYKIIALIQGFYILDVMVDIAWFFQGLEDFGKVALRNFTVKIINVAYVFIFVKSEKDLWIYVFGLAFLTFVGRVTMWRFVSDYLVRLEKYRPKPFQNVKDIIQLFIPSAAVQVYAVFDKTMIGWFTVSSAENGYYEQSEKIVKMCLMLITSLSTVMIPRISKAFAENRRKDLFQAVYGSYNFVWFLGVPLMFGLIAVAPVLVPVFFGPGYDKVKTLLPIFSILFLVMGLNSTTGSQYLITTGRQNIYSRIILAGGLVNALLNFILIPRWYSVGAAIASVLGEFTIMSVEFLYIYKTRQFSIRSVFSLSKKYLAAGLLMLAVLIFLRSLLPVTAISLALLILLGGLIYFGILILMRDSFIWTGIDGFKQKFFRKGD